jgi:hypothetical protein
MVKAQDLINCQKERDTIKFKTFGKIYNKIEKKIMLASSINLYYIWYEIPEFIIGCPLYNLEECKKFIIKQIKENGFTVEEFNENIILITWCPK